MILTAFWAWAFFHNAVPLKLVSTNDIETAFTSIPNMKTLALFKDTKFYKNLVHFQHQFIPNRYSSTFSVICTHPVRFHLKGVEARAFSQIPNGDVLYSVASVSPNLYIPTPILYLLSRVNVISSRSLLYLTNLMLGPIKRFPEQREKGKAILSKKEINDFVQQNDGRSISALRNILPYTLENMESPAEAQLATLLFAPKKLGGCELPLPIANSSSVLNTEQRGMLDGAKYIRPDFYWPKHNFGLEYDSAQYHHLPAANDRDRRRALAAGLSNTLLFPVTPSLLQNPSTRSCFVHALAKRLKVRLPEKESWYRAQELLWQEIRLTEYLC